MKNLAYLALSLLMISCHKEEEKAEEKPVIVKDFTIEALTGKNWKQVEDTNPSTNPQNAPYTYAPIFSCQKDDIYTFNNSAEMIINQGQNVCSGTLPVSKTSYSVDLVKKTITINGVENELLELSATRLKYYDARPSLPAPFHYIRVYEHP